MVSSKIKSIFGKLSDKKGAGRKKSDTKDSNLELSPKQIAQLERKLEYKFRDKTLLVQSLTHPSFLLNTKLQLRNNQRLEFLGDSVIQLALTERLFEKHPRMREGKLTSIRARFACGEFMAEIARQLKLQNYLILKPRERSAGVHEQESALGDAFEALIGAVYLDSDWNTARDITLNLYNNLNTKEIVTQGIRNPKGKLQELVQPVLGNDALRYETTDTQGNPHDRVFEVTVFCQDRQYGVGKGRTKKEAAENAALQAIDAWNQRQG